MPFLTKDFYSRETLDVAKDLLGKVLCRRIDGKILKGMIVETEAYTQEEPSCHAFHGKTPRCESLFAEPGTAYVYFTYGMYHCCNISTYKKDFGSGVLIRALEPLQNLDNTNGPGKLCREMNITRALDGVNIKTKKSDLWIENYKSFANDEIIQTTRIGIKLAADYPWRFYIKDNKWVSKK